jgi:hypothetical protein
MFQMTNEEFGNLKYHFGTSSCGGTRKLPNAFTETMQRLIATIAE